MMYVNDTNKNYSILLEAIKTNGISAEDLLDAFTNWHGLQLLDDDFIGFLEDEHIILKYTTINPRSGKK